MVAVEVEGLEGLEGLEDAESDREVQEGGERYRIAQLTSIRQAAKCYMVGSMLLEVSTLTESRLMMPGVLCPRFQIHI